ncbi:hypothetical protein PR048_019887 [Dryococelus australis]|uniref:Uncharacterized protein n=1 Tax=Dryococelus australis TaxID=614101 RepID=A0ABQ9H4W0_9NEOP|nr:hypothetical protein PR048_019887 [Dryococelus australis]
MIGVKRGGDESYKTRAPRQRPLRFTHAKIQARPQRNHKACRSNIIIKNTKVKAAYTADATHTRQLNVVHDKHKHIANKWSEALSASKQTPPGRPSAPGITAGNAANEIFVVVALRQQDVQRWGRAVRRHASSLQSTASWTSERTTAYVGTRWSSGQTTCFPPRRTGFYSQIFTCDNRAGRCLWSGGGRFLGDSPFPPLFHSGAAPYSPHFTFIGSQDLVVKSHSNHPTPLHSAKYTLHGMVRLHASYHLGEPSSIPGRATPGFSHVEILPDDDAGWWVSSGISSFPRPWIPALLNTHLTWPSSALKSSKLRAAQISQLNSLTNYTLTHQCPHLCDGKVCVTQNSVNEVPSNEVKAQVAVRLVDGKGRHIRRAATTVMRVWNQWIEEGRTQRRAGTGPRNVTTARNGRHLIRWHAE